MNMNEAVALSNAMQSHLTMEASSSKKGMCACRGACKGHTGPCGSKAMDGCSECKSCSKGMKAAKK